MKKGYRIPKDMNQVVMPFKEHDKFDAWAKIFFIRKRQLNKMIPYKVALDSFRTAAADPDYSSLKFKKALTDWCSEKRYDLDPKEYHNAAGRIIRKSIVSYGKTVATEMLFIKSPVKKQNNANNKNPISESGQPEGPHEETSGQSRELQAV